MGKLYVRLSGAEGKVGAIFFWLTESSLYLFWGGCCDEDSPPPPAFCAQLGSSGVCLLPSAKQLPLWRRGGEGLATGTEVQGKAGPAAVTVGSIASNVRVPFLLAKHRFSRQPLCAVVCALLSFL